MTAKTNLSTPAYNASNWNTPLNSNFSTLNDALGATESVAVALADVTLTATQAQKMRVLVTGSLTADRVIFIPAATSGFWIITNATTGNYSVTVKNVGGSTGPVITQGCSAIVYSDGANVYLADDTSSVMAGTIIQFAGVAAPIGYIACDGAAISRATYVRLFGAIGTTWGVGNGSSTFNVPDFRGYFLRGTGTNSDGAVGPAVGGKQADDFASHTHTATQAPHTHNIAVNTNSVTSGGGSNQPVGSTYNTPTSSAQPAITVAATGGTETRPKNQGILYCIKY